MPSFVPTTSPTRIVSMRYVSACFASNADVFPLQAAMFQDTDVNGSQYPFAAFVWNEFKAELGDDFPNTDRPVRQPYLCRFDAVHIECFNKSLEFRGRNSQIPFVGVIVSNVYYYANGLGVRVVDDRAEPISRPLFRVVGINEEEPYFDKTTYFIKRTNTVQLRCADLTFFSQTGCVAPDGTPINCIQTATLTPGEMPAMAASASRYLTCISENALGILLIALADDLTPFAYNWVAGADVVPRNGFVFVPQSNPEGTRVISQSLTNNDVLGDFGACFAISSQENISFGEANGTRVFCSSNLGYGLFEIVLPVEMGYCNDRWNAIDTIDGTGRSMTCERFFPKCPECRTVGSKPLLSHIADSDITNRNDGLNCRQTLFSVPKIVDGTLPTNTSIAPTAIPMPAPVSAPTPSPSGLPVPEPTPSRSDSPVYAPSSIPTPFPSANPSSWLTPEPSGVPVSAPTSSPSGAPVLAPTLSPSDSCPGMRIVLDFEGLTAGQQLSELSENKGITVITPGASLGSKTVTVEADSETIDVIYNAATVFDADCEPYVDCSGKDNDLSYPEQGNIVIINENTKEKPDDSRKGGTLVFDFRGLSSQPIIVESMLVLDTESADLTEEIELYIGGVLQQPKIDAPVAGENGQLELVVDRLADEFVFVTRESFALDDIRLCIPFIPTSVPTFTPSDVPVSAPTLLPSGFPVAPTSSPLQCSHPEVTGFFLIDTRTNEIVEELVDGATICLNRYDYDQFNIKAEVCGPTESVKFELLKQGRRKKYQVYWRLERFEPYALFSNSFTMHGPLYYPVDVNDCSLDDLVVASVPPSVHGSVFFCHRMARLNCVAYLTARIMVTTRRSERSLKST